MIRDILHRLADRFPVHVLVWPVRVQGETSAAEVAQAIRGFNALRPGGDPPAGSSHRRPRRRLARGLVGLQRGDRGARGGGERNPADFGGRPRDGLDPDRPRRRHARADADRRGRTQRAGALRTAREARRSRRARRGAMLRLGQRRRGELRAVARALPSGEAMLAGPRQRLDRPLGDGRARARGSTRARSPSRGCRAGSPASRRARGRRACANVSARSRNGWRGRGPG